MERTKKSSWFKKAFQYPKRALLLFRSAIFNDAMKLFG